MNNSRKIWSPIFGALLLASLTGCLGPVGTGYMPDSGYTDETSAGRAILPAGPAVADEQFKATVLDSTQPVLVEFYMRRCGYCITYNETLQSVASRHAGTLKLVQIDAQTNPSLTYRYGVSVVPTTLIFSNGTLMEGVVGKMTEAELEATIQSYIQ